MQSARIKRTAKRMVKKYGSHCAAQEMTFYNRPRAFWWKVWKEIQRLYELAD